MRSLLLVMLLVAACGGRTTQTTLPAHSPTVTPARDLAAAKSSAPRDPAGAHLVAKDPRIVDLDIIRITASSRGVGGDPQLDHVATGDLFKQANDAAKSGETERAIQTYRRIATDFPESQYSPVALFNIAAIHDGRADYDLTIATLRELAKTYPNARESVDGHLYIAALQSDRGQFTDALVTLGETLQRTNFTHADRIEVFARQGYVLIELVRYEEADAALTKAIDEWRKVTRLEDPYYIAMAHYYRGELSHRKFAEAPARLPDDVLVADLEKKRVLAVEAYDRWKQSLGFKQAYWATASGYQMSQIFVELWEAHVRAPYPKRIEPAGRQKYVEEVHDRVREHLAKALEGHRMNVELAKAYGVETVWSKASAQKAGEVMGLLAREGNGQYVTPVN